MLGQTYRPSCFKLKNQEWFSVNLMNTTQTFTIPFTYLLFVINKCQSECHLARLIPSYLPVVPGKAGSSLSVSVAQKKKQVPGSEPSFERAPSCRWGKVERLTLLNWEVHLCRDLPHLPCVYHLQMHAGPESAIWSIFGNYKLKCLSTRDWGRQCTEKWR